MANLSEDAVWVDGIYQLEDTDPVSGGVPNLAIGDGMDNVPHQQLAKRTSWLKSRVDVLMNTVVAATTSVAGIVRLSSAVNSGSDTMAATPSAVKAAFDNAESRVPSNRVIATAGLATGGGSLGADRTITVPVATQAQAQTAAVTPASADNTSAMTALRVAQFFAALGLPSAANLVAAVADTTAIRPIATGGTGGNTAAAARTAMGLNDLVVPVGMVAHYAAPSPPAGWLVRDGAAYSRTVYAALFAAIGTTYGAGNGSTTFNVPDDRANFDRGHSGSRGIDAGRVFGSEQEATHTLQKMHDWAGADVSVTNGSGIGQSFAHADTESLSLVPPANARNANGGAWSSGSADNMSVSAHDGIHDPNFLGRWISYRPRNRAYLPIIKF